MKEYADKEGAMFNLEATPAESASFVLAKADRADGGFTSGTDENPFYTNSCQFPVNNDLDLWETLEKQQEMQNCFTGGTVLHLFFKERILDTDVLVKLLKRALEYKIPYISFTPTFSICPVHGYSAGEHWFCEKEHTPDEITRFGTNGKMENQVYSRIVGYFRPVKNWNKGKQQEFSERKEFECFPQETLDK
jgi:ribonucleoside-triphosphate reductase (formate)